MVYCAAQDSCVRAIGCERHDMNRRADWQVESLRITVFPEDNARTSPSRLWDQFVGEKPDNVQIEQSKFDARQKILGNRITVLVKQPAQIDWQFPIVPQDNESKQSMPNWGSLHVEVDSLLQFSRKWLTCVEIMPVIRLAFGAVLLIPANDEVTAYERLQQLFPGIDPRSVSDFSYQINRRRGSRTVEGLTINRLSRWNIATLERLVSPLDPFAETDDNLPTRLNAVRAELDINTGPHTGHTLPSESLVTVFDELVEMALEIAREGDV